MQNPKLHPMKTLRSVGVLAHAPARVAAGGGAAAAGPQGFDRGEGGVLHE